MFHGKIHYKWTIFHGFHPFSMAMFNNQMVVPVAPTAILPPNKGPTNGLFGLGRMPSEKPMPRWNSWCHGVLKRYHTLLSTPSEHIMLEYMYIYIYIHISDITYYWYIYIYIHTYNEICLRVSEETFKGGLNHGLVPNKQKSLNSKTHNPLRRCMK